MKRKLAAQDPPILVISVHPGAVETDLQQTWTETYGTVGKIIQYITNKVGKSAAEGAEASLWAATSTDIHEGNWKDYQVSKFECKSLRMKTDTAVHHYRETIM